MSFYPPVTGSITPNIGGSITPVSDSGIGIVLLTFAFHLPPGKPPVDVMLTIIAVVAASATLQASGGLEVLLKGAERCYVPR